MGYIRTGLLIAGLTALFGGIGFAIAGQVGLIVALLIAGAMNLFAYWNSDKLALRMHGAREVSEQAAPDLVRLVRQLADRAGLPMPRVYVIDQEQPNAFATGRSPSHAAVAVTTGIMRALTWEQLAGVIAHELAHIKNRDTLIMTVTATLAGAISILANFALFFGRGSRNPLGIVGLLLMMILAPLAAMMVQMAISRTREYEADRIGAEICGRPLWLAEALTRIQDQASRITNQRAEANPATAHLFIINPLRGQRMDSLFSTHPATANRVARLHAMAGQAAPQATRNPWA